MTSAANLFTLSFGHPAPQGLPRIAIYCQKQY